MWLLIQTLRASEILLWRLTHSFADVGNCVLLVLTLSRFAARWRVLQRRVMLAFLSGTQRLARGYKQRVCLQPGYQYDYSNVGATLLGFLTQVGVILTYPRSSVADP